MANMRPSRNQDGSRSDGSARFYSARNALHLALLYLSLFLLPQLFLGLELGFFFWLVLFVSCLLGIYAFEYGSHMLQYYFLFFVFTLMLGYFLQFFVGVRFLPSQLMPDKINGLAAVVFGLHFLGLVLGSWVRGKHRRSKKPTRQYHANVHFFYIGFFVWVLILAAVFWLLGFDQIFSQRSEIFSEEINPMVSFLAKAAKACSFVLVAITIASAGKKLSLEKILIVTTITILALLTANPTNTARFVSLAGLVLVLVTYLGHTGRSKHLISFLVVASYAAIVLMPVTSLLRSGFSNVNMGSVFEIYSSLEFSSIQLMLDGIAVADEINGGNLLISGLAIIVPRSIFPDKAGAVGPEIAHLSGYVFENTAVPSFFIGYLDFGLIGVVLVSLVMGYLFQIVDIRDDFDVRRRLDGYKAILLASVPIIARGDLSTAMISIYAFAAAYEVMRFTARLTFRAPRKYSARIRME